MDDQEIIEQRYRFFSEKGIMFAADHTKTFITLFTGIIAGLILLVIGEDVGFWPGVFFLASALCALWGMTFSVLHLNFTSRLMFLFAAHLTSEKDTPNVLEPAKPSVDRIQQCKQNCQSAFISQMVQTGFSILFAVAGFGVAENEEGSARIMNDEG